jgi:DNA-binding CsgD family transcriptional regulator
MTVHAGDLTDRERQILQGMADGKANAEIGAGICITEDTVKTHAQQLFRKLGARNRAHAVRIGFDAGLLRPTPTARVRAVLDAERLTRQEAPQDSRYAHLYDAVQAALTPGATSPAPGPDRPGR